MLSPPVAAQPWIGENSKEFALLRLSHELSSLATQTQRAGKMVGLSGQRV